MRGPAWLGFLVLVLALSSVAGTRGQVPRPPAQAPPASAAPTVGTGFLAGQVVDHAGKPVPEAMVQLGGQAVMPGGRAGALLQPVVADSQGRFFFAGLPPGDYLVRAGKTGYTSTMAGPVTVGDNERVMNLRVQIQKLASLTGTLRDESGDPAVGVDVVAARRQVQNGRQTWLSAGRSRSDDRGAYRFGNLQAGDYVICACSRDPIPFDGQLLTTLGSEPLQLLNVAARALSVGSDAVSLDNTLRTYAPTFYQNGATLARAERVALAPGDEKTGLDILLPLVRATRVSGRVIGAEGPVQAGSMRLVPEGDAEAGSVLAAIPPMLVQPDGRFDFATVPPGPYRLMIVHRPNLPLNGPSGAAMAFAGSRGATQPAPGMTMSAGGAAAQEPPMWASEPIAVGEDGVTGVVVTLNRSLAVSGRVEWIGSAPQPPAQMLNRAMVILQPVSRTDPLASVAGTPVGRFSPDATFQIPGALPGKYVITANALPGFPTLKSVMAGGMDITDLPLEIGDRDVTNVVLTYVSTPMALLTATVSAPAAPAAGQQELVLVFPADRRYWAEPSAARRRFQQVTLTAKGAATTPGLPAGDYFAVYASALDAADWMEATKLETLSRRAQRVTVPESGTASVEVRR